MKVVYLNCGSFFVFLLPAPPTVSQAVVSGPASGSLSALSRQCIGEPAPGFNQKERPPGLKGYHKRLEMHSDPMRTRFKGNYEACSCSRHC
jgi:hypothetical protein